jgi:low affinity Fe/Cu permease
MSLLQVKHEEHGLKITLQRTPEGGLTANEPRESVFLRIADYVSAAMGRPTNIMIWLLAVIAWTGIFAFGGPYIASGTWLPAWFTSQGFNFPLNLITTVAELFIGFLVAAASNRSERNLENTLGRIEQVETTVTSMLRDDVSLTKAIHDMQVQQLTILQLLQGKS